MSIRVWALNKETGEVMHINSVSKDMKGKMVCLDENCGEELLICKGAVNKPYFSHKSNTSCHGGSTETLLHMLSKQILKKCGTFTLPEESVIFRGKKIIFAAKRNILVREVELNVNLGSGLRAVAKLTDFSNEEFYIEPSVRGISNSRVEAFRKKDVNLVEIDLRKFAKIGEDLDIDELTHFICNGSGVKNFICSKSINDIERKVASSIYVSNGKYIACPAYDYEGIVDIKKCSTCPFYMYSVDSTITCSGKGCYSDSSDFQIQSTDRRRSKYENRIPKPLWSLNRYLGLQPFGECPDCGSEMRLSMTSKQSTPIAGINYIIRELPHCVYIECPNCHRLEPLFCPKCGRELRVHVNRTSQGYREGTVFIMCEGYSNKSNANCDFSLTLFDGVPCGKNYARELKLVRQFKDLYTDYSEIMRKVRKG